MTGATPMHTSSEAQHLIQAWLLARLSTLLKVPVDALRTDRSLASLGVDSVVAMGLLGDLEDWLQCRIDDEAMHEAENISDLAALLAQRQDVCTRVGAPAQMGIPAAPVLFVEAPTHYHGGENFDLAEIIRVGAAMPFHERVDYLSQAIATVTQSGQFRREITSPMDRMVTLADHATGGTRQVLMFGSNSYLGLANDPRVAHRVREVLDMGAVGLGAPPLLSGFTRWHRELEERLAAFKGTEAAMIYPSGYSANVGLVTACCTSTSMVICDEYSHASFLDGIKQAKVPHRTFAHNNLASLENLLQRHKPTSVDLFVGVEGLYSMDGDVPPLDAIGALCRQYGATLLIDDAHATGVIGPTGKGITERFDLGGTRAIVMGTFSKALASVGGFICGSSALIDYLRFMSRPYVFSASMPPTLVAQVLGGLDVLEHEPGRLAALRANIGTARAHFNDAGIPVHNDAESPIFAILAPQHMDIRQAGQAMQRLGIFVNTVTYPAVPRDQQRFRVSLMASHTEEDIASMVKAFSAIWADSASTTATHDRHDMTPANGTAA